MNPFRRHEDQRGQPYQRVVQRGVAPHVGLNRNGVSRPVQRPLAASRDIGLVLETADVGLQAGEDFGYLDDHRALLRCGRVREVLSHELPPDQGHGPDQMGRLIRPRAKRAGKRPGGDGDEKDGERRQPEAYERSARRSDQVMSRCG